MFSFRHIRSGLLIALACGSMGSAMAFDVPNLLHAQDRLTDSGGAPLVGSVTVMFRIWDDDTAGSMLWTETQTLTALDGAINTILGGTSSLPTTLFDGGPLWLGLEV